MRAPLTAPPRAVAFLALAALLALAAAPTATASISGVTYAPYTPESRYCLDPTEVERDAKIMFSFTKRVRTYAIACPNSTDVLLSVAKRMGGQVFVGVRLGNTKAKIDNEFAKLAVLLQTWGRSGAIYALGVGNEWLAAGGDLHTLLTSLDRARKLAAPYKISITTAELPEIWNGKSLIMQSGVGSITTPSSTYYSWCLTKLPIATCALLARVDWVGLQVHPYFKSLPVSCTGSPYPGCYDAATWVINTTHSIYGLTKKWTRVSEVGWPTKGERCCKINAPGFPKSASYLSVPSLQNAATFLTSLEQKAAASGFTVFHFQAFDPDWKRVWVPCKCTASMTAKLDYCNTECEFDYNWGIYYSSRKLKPYMKL